MKNGKPGDGFTAATVLELLPVAVIGVGPAYEITFINDQALSDLDMKREAVLGKMFFTLFEDGPACVSAARLLRDGVPLRGHEFKTTQGDSAWVLADSAPMAGGAEPDNTYLFLRNITAGRKREELFSYLNHAAAALVQTRDTGTALLRIAEFIVPSFADWFTVDVLREGTLELILLRHEDPGKIEWARKYRKAYPPDPNGNSQAAQVIRTGKPVFIPFLTEEMIDQGMQDAVQRSEIKKIGLCSVIMAPMFSGGTVTGLVNFISSRQSRHFDERDLDFALNFANLITLSLENARLHEGAQGEIERRRMGEERFRFLLDAIPHKIWTSGPDGRATYYNKQWHEFTGISGFENLREKVWDILHPDDLADAAERWPQAVRNGEDMELENRFRQYDGTYRWHLSRVSPVKDDAGGVMFWIGTSTDIHEQKLYELELAGANEELTAGNEELAAANQELNRTRERLTAAVAGLENSKMRFQLFLDSIPQIAWSGDANAEVTYYNMRWYEYTGLTFDQTRNWGWKQVIHPDDLEHTMTQLAAIIDSRKAGEFETRERDSSGVYRWHLVRTMPVFGSDGELEQWVGTATDIDDLKKIQQQKDDFISIASHELKTPLTSLRATIQLLYKMRDNPDPGRFRQLVEQANRSMFKMTSLVEDLLNKSRFSDAQVHPQKKWFILSELANSCCNPVAVSGQHEINVLGDKRLEVLADERAIDQVIVNFVNNAVKYGTSSRPTEVIIDTWGNGAKLSVKDYGQGILPEHLPFVFDRYYQGGKRDFGNPGLGLGLYISSEIIKRHGGKIGVESEPGKGSTFWFTLPEAR